MRKIKDSTRSFMKVDGIVRIVSFTTKNLKICWDPQNVLSAPAMARKSTSELSIIPEWLGIQRREIISRLASLHKTERQSSTRTEQNKLLAIQI